MNIAPTAGPSRFGIWCCVIGAGLAASAASAQLVDTRVPLNYNFHGMAHTTEAVVGATAANADIILYRSMSDRGLYWDPADPNAFGTVPIVGFTGLTYSLFDTLGYANTTSIAQADAALNALDMVHLGRRGVVYRPYDNDGATTNGPFPAWAPDAATNTDHTVDQVTILSSPVLIDAATEIGVLYQASDSGGQFDVVLTFNNGVSDTNVTVRVAAPDWFGNAADPAIVAGQPVSSQRKLSRVSGSSTFTTYRGVAGVDSATLQTFSTTNAGPNLNVMEAVISVPAIISGGNNVAGQNLTRITFRNPTYPTRAISSLSGNGTVASMTTTTAHGFGVGTTIVVAGANVAGLNGTYTVASVPTATTLTYANTTVAASTTGTRTVFGQGVHRGYGIFAVTTRTGSPANSSCNTAFPIGTGTTAGTNSHALTAAPSGFGNNDTSAVWYAYTAPSSTLVDVRTCGSGLDSTLVVFAGCGGPVVASNDNGCGTASRVQWQATAGQTYFIRVAGNNGATGNFNLTLQDPADVDITMPLQFNWNGICHGVSEQTLPAAGGTVGQTNENRSNLNGFRAIADRGLLCDGIQSDALNFGGTIGYQGMVYNVYSTPLQSDMVHMGNRDLAAGGIRAFSPIGTTWPAQGGTATTQNGLSPLWLSNPDHTGPQTSSMSGLNAVFGANTKMGVLYHMSNVDTLSGTTPRPAFFDVVLGFTDGSFATVTVQATDWFGTNTQVLPGAVTGTGLEVQRVLGIYHAVQNTDIAADAPTGRLKVMEAVISTAELISAGFDPTGRTLASVTFANLRSGNLAQDSIYSALGVYAATLRNPASFNLNFGPAGTGTVTPNLLTAGTTGKMTVNVARGSGSPNNITTVVVDASSIGLGNVALNDSGQFGDVQQNDNVWSTDIRFPIDTIPNAFSLPFTVTDAQARTASGNIIFTITAPTGSFTPSTVVVGNSTLATIVLSPNTGGDANISSVTLDGSSLALGTISLNDSGTNGDATANDGRWNATVNVPANAGVGPLSIPFTITDAINRTATGLMALTTVGPPFVQQDFGDISSPACIGTTFDASAGTITWLQFSLSQPVAAGSGTFLDIDTHDTLGCVDMELGLYSASGDLIATDDNNGSGNQALLSFGLGGRAAFTAGGCTGASVAYDGQNGSLAAGTYYLAVGRFNSTFNTTLWDATTTGAFTSSVHVNLCTAIPNRPPQGAGAATPNPVVEGQSFLATVTVTPGTNPVSQTISVVADASLIGGGSSVALNDAGIDGDLVPSDGIYSATLTANVAASAQTIPFTVSDDQARSSSGSIALTVSNSATGGCCDQFGGCTITREFLCIGAGNTFAGAGTNCGGGGYSFSASGGEFEDISATGTVISATPGDDAVFNVALSFPFTYFDVVYTDVNVSTNGNLQFAPSNSTSFTNTAIPNAAVPNNMLAVLWDDFNFNVNSNDSLMHETRGTPGFDQRQIFQWTGVAQFLAAADTDFNTFQCVLFEDGHVEFRYASIAADFSTINNDTSGATVGLEDGSATALSVQYGQGASPVTSNSSLTISAGIVASPCDPCAVADFNQDGDLNPDDLGDYINCYFGIPPCDGADFNNDGDVNPDDLGDYINAYFGCT